MNKGDIVVFSLTSGVYEGKIVKVYDSNYIKIRYRRYGLIPIYRIDTITRMNAWKPKVN